MIFDLEDVENVFIAFAVIIYRLAFCDFADCAMDSMGLDGMNAMQLIVAVCNANSFY